jgi:protein farnesyltransferase subunit beta
MKQPDGGFSMVQGGEVDIRGAYCSMVLIALLDLPIELPPDSPTKLVDDGTFLTNLENWLTRCQTYEGGIAGAPNNEAHGAYAFCGLACLSIIDAPSRSIAGNLDMNSLISGLSSLQHAPESGFAGRTNKLVDGCYSHWVGGCWSLITAALDQPATQAFDLWSREGLIRYILCCCQNHRGGGLRDKPSKGPDAYHSCYVLAGLSASQYVYEFQDEERFELVKGTAGFGWTVAGRAEGLPIEEQDYLRAIHPVFVVPFERVEECRRYFEEMEGF